MAGSATDISQLRFRLKVLSRKVWVRVAAFAVLGVITATAGAALKGLIPDSLPGKIGADAIESILQILASSMLAVTTFSLSILTAAYANAGSSATPRATGLLVSDSVSQTVLSTFIGAFLFSLVSIILLKTGIYGSSGRLVLFAVTLLVVLVVVVSLLRWIDELGRIGLVGDTLARVAEAGAEAMAQRLKSPWMGANPLRGAPPEDAVVIRSDQVGYVQHLDMARLSRLADKTGVLVYMNAIPGDFLSPASTVMRVQGVVADLGSLSKEFLACLTIRDSRDYEQDPRHGLQVLSEIGQRALSPAVNDPGTAILALNHMLKILSKWSEESLPEVEYPRIFLQSISAAELLEEAVLPLARDGAGNFQLQRHLQQTLLALSRISPQVYAEAAGRTSRHALALAAEAVALKSHRAELESISGLIVID
ncbi:DUF2254 domain-containing protein [Paracoccus spongiarum]|uniref:DUF2254 domain-containing protein n=1 Tax=Paracoccus spongiarum TaxID=3064387 RepID=A0ABT9JD54_9RHOB|nr:DUF2254 domain-containing protein [Paracoccus sp. 2205BS29-5]MDP5307709.1 DUF2254 domain-containing protein [Paracoccus sp. 2205BS29-5]